MVKIQKWVQARVMLFFSKIEFFAKIWMQKNTFTGGIKHMSFWAEIKKGQSHTVKISQK